MNLQQVKKETPVTLKIKRERERNVRIDLDKVKATTIHNITHNVLQWHLPQHSPLQESIRARKELNTKSI